jgi:hypothetical protein
MLSFGEANLFHEQVAGHSVSDELISAMKLAQTPVYRIPGEEAELHRHQQAGQQSRSARRAPRSSHPLSGTGRHVLISQEGESRT